MTTPHYLSAVLIAILAGLTSQATSFADPLQWGTGGAGGVGTWAVGSTNWYNGAANVAWSDGSIASFGGTANTVTLSGVHVVGGISNSIAGYTLSGGGIALTGATAEFNLPQNLTISSLISGSSSLKKIGAGRLTLSGNNVGYTGNTLIQGGWISAKGNAALGSGQVEISGANSTLGLENVTLNNAIAMTNGVGSTGPRIYMDSGSSTLNGTVSIQTNFSKFQIGSGTLTFNNTVTASAYALFSPAVANGIMIFKNKYSQAINGFTDHEGLGELVFQAANNEVRTLIVRQGKVRTDVDGAFAESSIIRFGGNSVLSAGAKAVLDLNGHSQTISQIIEISGILNESQIKSNTGSTLTLKSDSLASSFNGSIEGAISLVKEGSAALSLGGDNTYTGDTEIKGGSFTLTSTGTLTFKVLGNGENNQILGGGNILLNGGFTFDLSQADTSSGNSWQIIAADSLSHTTFGTTFSVNDFTQDGSNWVSGNYRFSTDTGILQSIPEPSTFGLIAFSSLVLGGTILRRRK